MEINLNWDRFKARVLLDKSRPKFESDSPNTYILWVSCESVLMVCSLNKGSNLADYNDFENNYKIKWNKSNNNDFGIGLVSPTLDDVQGLYPKKKMYAENVIAGKLNIFDYMIDVEKRISGGEYWIYPEDSSKIHKKDYLEFSVIDKNDVLGIFNYYGLIPGVDILELTKFVKTDYIKKGNSAEGYHSQLFEGIKGTNALVAGLFLRVAYFSVGTQDLDFFWRLYYYE